MLPSTRRASRANGRAATTRSCARRSFDAATIFMAFVICCVDFTARMRRRMSMREGTNCSRHVASLLAYGFLLASGFRLDPGRGGKLLAEIFQRRVHRFLCVVLHDLF